MVKAFSKSGDELVNLLESMKMTKNKLETQNLVDEIRYVVFVEAGIWQPDEI
jgi:hypothetical protein